jgi:DNA-directed RNA polymerase III subunit RPC7
MVRDLSRSKQVCTNQDSADSQFFPKELWPTLKIKSKPLLNGSKAGLQASTKTKGKRKLDEDDEVDGEVARVQAKKPRLDNASDKKGAVENSTGATGRSRVKRVIEDDEDEEDEQEKEEEAKMLHDSDEEEEEEIVDDEFSDEEDGDYNAEQYFDDGSDGYDDAGGDDADGYDDTF